MLSHSFGFSSVVLLGYLCLSLRTNYTGHERENTPERESGPVATLTQKRSKCHWQTRRFLSHESDGRFCDGTWGRLSQRPPKMHRSANAVGRRAFRWEFNPPLHNGSSDGKKKNHETQSNYFFVVPCPQYVHFKLCLHRRSNAHWENVPCKTGPDSLAESSSSPLPRWPPFTLCVSPFVIYAHSSLRRWGKKCSKFPGEEGQRFLNNVSVGDGMSEEMKQRKVGF